MIQWSTGATLLTWMTINYGMDSDYIYKVWKKNTYPFKTSTL